MQPPLVFAATVGAHGIIRDTFITGMQLCMTYVNQLHWHVRHLSVELWHGDGCLLSARRGSLSTYFVANRIFCWPQCCHGLSLRVELETLLAIEGDIPHERALVSTPVEHW